MKLFSKILSLLLCICMLLSFAACGTASDGETPDGMKLATAAGADFRLYVPTVWNSNTAYGVSGAYYTMSKQSTVSAVKYVITEEMRAELDKLTLEPESTSAETKASEEGTKAESESVQVNLGISGVRIEWFWQNELLPAVEEAALGGSVMIIEEDCKSGLLDGANAKQYHLTANVNGSKTHFVYTVAERGGAFYVLSFLADDELYEALLNDVNRIAEEFRFADEAYLPDNYVKELDTAAEAPDGMRLASNDDVAYRFYVPNTWEINRDEEIFAAYLKSDFSSVSVVPYLPDAESMSVAEFYALCEQMMEATAGADGYELLKTEKDVDLGGRVATAYTYTYTVGGVKYQYLQVIAAYKSMLYSLTYTSLPENFDSHLDDVTAMIENFEFR